jgi:hypothetical protein
MSPRFFAKFAGAFGLTLAVYLLLFHGAEHWRNRRGGWEVRFTQDALDQPTLLINQPALRITNCAVVLAGERTNAPLAPLSLRFDRPLKEVPWGRVLYQDPTVQPGVVTLLLLGHEIELMPRTLVLNRHEIKWQSHVTNVLTADDRLPTNLIQRARYKRETGR